jgi:membrane protease YdiL (CAAX protease family)
MSEASPDASSILGPRSATWLDLVLYLVGGIGVFVLASTGAQFLFAGTSILASLTLYLLNFVTLTGAVYVWGVHRGKLSWEEMGLLPPKLPWRWLLAAIVASATLIPVRIALGYAALRLFEGGVEGVQARADVFLAGASFSWVNFGLTLLGAGMLAPVAEELYFRGLIHGWLKSRGSAFWLRVLISSTLFALAHFDSFAVAVSSLVLGLANAVLYERSRTIWVPIAMHAFTNSFAVTLMYAALAMLEYFPVMAF